MWYLFARVFVTAFCTSQLVHVSACAHLSSCTSQLVHALFLLMKWSLSASVFVSKK